MATGVLIVLVVIVASSLAAWQTIAGALLLRQLRAFDTHELSPSPGEGRRLPRARP
jgi:hypothetical protein